MTRRGAIGALGVAMLCATVGGAAAWDDAKYPDLKDSGSGRRSALGTGGQKAPLTPEYQKVFDANLPT